MRDDPPGINRYEREEAEAVLRAEATCDFGWMTDDGPVYCMAPAIIDFRFRWKGEPQGPSGGSMCEGHWLIAAIQLDEDPDIDTASIQLRRRQP